MDGIQSTTNKYVVRIDNDIEFVYSDRINTNCEINQQIIYDEIKYKLHEEILTRKPCMNYNIWDIAEIDILESYREQFAYLIKKYPNDKQFMQNWKNCDASIIYYNENIRTQYENFNPSIGMKQSIREGTASLSVSMLTDEMIDIAIQMKSDYAFSIDGSNACLLEKITSGQPISMSFDRYIHLKSFVQDGANPEGVDMLLQRAIIENKYKLVTIYK